MPEKSREADGEGAEPINEDDQVRDWASAPPCACS